MALTATGVRDYGRHYRTPPVNCRNWIGDLARMKRESPSVGAGIISRGLLFGCVCHRFFSSRPTPAGIPQNSPATPPPAEHGATPSRFGPQACRRAAHHGVMMLQVAEAQHGRPPGGQYRRTAGPELFDVPLGVRDRFGHAEGRRFVASRTSRPARGASRPSITTAVGAKRYSSGLRRTLAIQRRSRTPHVFHLREGSICAPICSAKPRLARPAGALPAESEA